MTHYGSPQDDIGHSILQSRDGSYVILGQTTRNEGQLIDILLSRNDSVGVPVWQKTFGGNAVDIGKSIVELPDSSLVFTGYSNSSDTSGYDVIVSRTTKNGELIWSKNYGGKDWDFGYTICKSGDGNLIVCGSTYSWGNGGKDGLVMKLDYQGNLIWSKTFGGKKEDELKDIVLTNDGGFMTVGSTKSYGDSLSDIWLVRLNASGNQVWSQTKGGNKKDVGTGIVVDKNGDYLVCGGSESFTKGKEDIFIFKISESKIISWQVYYGSPNFDEEANDILLSRSSYGDMVVLYSTMEISTLDVKNILLDKNGYYLRGGSKGDVAAADEAYAMCNTRDKGYIACGYTGGYNSLKKDVYIIKYDSEMTIGPMFVALDKLKPVTETKLYPTVIHSHYFYLEHESNTTPEIRIFDLMAVEIKPIKIEQESSNLYRCTIPDGVKGLIIVNLNHGSLTTKCFVD